MCNYGVHDLRTDYLKTLRLRTVALEHSNDTGYSYVQCYLYWGLTDRNTRLVTARVGTQNSGVVMFVSRRFLPWKCVMFCLRSVYCLPNYMASPLSSYGKNCAFLSWRCVRYVGTYLPNYMVSHAPFLGWKISLLSWKWWQRSASNFDTYLPDFRRSSLKIWHSNLSLDCVHAVEEVILETRSAFIWTFRKSDLGTRGI
jgi:hypothetical protein